jgi:signal transduction histidine kinase/DNA-binding response OmpR family regulator
MSNTTATSAEALRLRSELHFQAHRERILRQTDRIFAGLMLAQWIAAMVVAAVVSPRTWTGALSRVHPHLWAAALLGGAITALPVLLAVARPGRPTTRHVMATAQMLWSALLIHLTGGRIETHFHVFGSLAFLAFYRDFRVLLTATVVVAADHVLRGFFWPESVYGVVLGAHWRWVEHAWWVAFEDAFLIFSCRRGIAEMREIARRQAETELSGERRFETLVDSIDGVVWEAQARPFRPVFFSRRLETLLGTPRREWLAQPGFWEARVHPDDRERVTALYRDSIEKGASFDAEYRLLPVAGEPVWIRDVVTVLLEDGRPALCRGVMTDVTAFKRVESMKNDFISTVSHELRTPLTSIRGALGLVNAGIAGALPDRAKRMIDIAAKNSERLTNLVNDILDMEKILSGKMSFNLRPLELDSLVAQAVEANRPYAQSCGVALQLDARTNGDLVRADADRLMQVLANLLSNACKFSPKGETVRVVTERLEGRLRISVSDRGPGIPEEFRPRVFEKFAQADSGSDRQKSGTGLGLSITKGLVDRMSGAIGFETESGRGTTFTVDLPGVAVAPPAGGASRGRILVCEDEPDIALILRATLESIGYESDLTSTAGEAKEMLRRKRYDGMTLDLGLPDQDGISLVRELREDPATRSLPIVVVSAYIEEGRRILNGEAFGIVDWIEKPIDRLRLASALERGIEQRAGRRPRVLHVEDDADIVQVVRVLLEDDADLDTAPTLAAARESLRHADYDLLVLDIGLPDGSGLELLPELRASARPSIPVIVFSARQVSQVTARNVAATLLKSSTSNEELAATIRSLLERRLASASASA